MSRLGDRRIFITGAGSGIGEAAARRFANEGAAVAICDKRAALLLSDEASFVTGAALMVDGGLTAI